MGYWGEEGQRLMAEYKLSISMVENLLKALGGAKVLFRCALPLEKRGLLEAGSLTKKGALVAEAIEASKAKAPTFYNTRCLTYEGAYRITRG